MLTQQVVAETACREYADDELFETGASGLAVPQPRSAGVSTGWSPWRPTASPRGAAAAARCIHRDEVHGRLRGRRGARLLALTSGGAIPEVADYRVVLDPDDTVSSAR